ncbi:hypothetical protein RvVAR031_37800 [Agrobacterium vitis]|nr:hypothetical protein RvVAR031_37800 [Agrobacterium vitis]
MWWDMKRVKNEDIQYPEMRRRTLKTCVIELKTHIRADQWRLITLDIIKPLCRDGYDLNTISRNFHFHGFNQRIAHHATNDVRELTVAGG